MRIVNRQTFLGMPSGTIYAKWGDATGDPSHLYSGEVSMKGATVSADYVDEPFLPWPEGCSDSMQWIDAMVKAREGAPTAPLAIGDCGSRDGLFDEGQHFAVFERIEVERLIALLQSALKGAYCDQVDAGSSS